MGFYQIGAEKLPWGVECANGFCDRTIHPTVPAQDPDELFPVMLAAGWGFDAYAGANIPSCPEHTTENGRNNLARLVEDRQAKGGANHD